MTGVFLQVGILAFFLILGFTVGSISEKMHFKRLDASEAELKNIFMTDTRLIPSCSHVESCGMVVGEVVIASDYFKTFAAKLRGLLGGELRAFESLMVRARREALVRMLKSAKDLGANSVINVRFSTSNIGSMRNRRAAMVEMFAYGTALKVDQST